MERVKDEGDTPRTPPDRSTVILLLADIADTSWRMFLPTLGGFGLGLWADVSWATTPWGMLVGVLGGIAATTFLMKQQFQRVKNAK